MAVNGEICIFRMTASTDTETTITKDKVEFDGDAAVPDGRAGITSYSPVMSRGQTDNPAPFLEQNRKPDVGFSGLRYTLDVTFDESDGTSGAIGKLRDWYAQGNDIKGVFREGRFGLRNNYRQEFDLVPSGDAGYKLAHFEISHDLLNKRLSRGIIVLEFSGDPAELG